MNDAQHAYWQGYLRDLADRLGLKDWDVRINRDKPDGNCGADCLVWYGQKRATVRLNPDLFRRTDPEGRADQRWTITHECLHCHMEYADEAVRLASKDDDAPRTALFIEYYRRASELVIDGIATAIAPLLPLPEGAP
jgi:hypothetical protein